MKYIPATDSDRRAMLDAVGAETIEHLFDCVPAQGRTQTPLKIEGPLSERELLVRMGGYARRGASEIVSFLGAGSYEHFIPTIVDAMSSRGEFLTAYTAYQPELSQGILQATFEYQTMTADLLGTEVANASLYDGASAVAEAVLMALRLTRKRNRILLSAGLHPEYRETVGTYLRCREVELVDVPVDGAGRTDATALREALTPDTAGVVVQSPNFFGVVEDQATLFAPVGEAGAIAIGAFSEAVAFGLLTPAGALGADIVCGEGQSLGLPRSFGGPSLGMFGCRQKQVRQMPGRVVGLTTEEGGGRAFTLTLSTREQHIRREKATSNICTNQALCALRAGIAMAAFGRQGMRELARRNRAAALEAASLLTGGARLQYDAPFFNEFVMAFASPAAKTAALRRWEEAGMLGGVDLERFEVGLDAHVLSTFTEVHSPEQIATWARIAGEGA